MRLQASSISAIGLGRSLAPLQSMSLFLLGRFLVERSWFSTNRDRISRGMLCERIRRFPQAKSPNEGVGIVAFAALGRKSLQSINVAATQDDIIGFERGR